MARQPPHPKPPTTKSVPPPRPIPNIESSVRDALEGVVAQGALKLAVDRVTAVMISEQFSGPLPHPSHLAGYEAILPGSADRIIAMAEKTVDARLKLQDKGMQAEIDDGKLGMKLGAASFGLLVICGLVSNLVTGGTVATAIFLGAGAVGVIATFVNGRLKPKAAEKPKAIR